MDVEFSSVNLKQFDLRDVLTKDLISFEPRVRSLIEHSVSRVSVTGVVKASVADDSKGMSVFNHGRAGSCLREFRKMSKALGLKDDLTASSLLWLAGMIRCDNARLNETEVWPVLKKALNNAISALVKMKKVEGRALEKDITGRLAKLNGLLDQINKHAPQVTKRYRENLKKRLQEAGVNVDGGNQSLSREIVMFADKADISEEITRLRSHFSHADELIKGRKSCGRSLDFLCQEMFREINTIGSKSNDKSISKIVVQFKTELECVREQVQNVE